MCQKLIALAFALLISFTVAAKTRAETKVKPGDIITKDNAEKVKDLVSPGNFYLVKQGMVMKIVPSDRVAWPPPYKSATEKYSGQVSLAPDGSLKGFIAGQPFPLLDPNDPQMAYKVMWNYS